MYFNLDIENATKLNDIINAIDKNTPMHGSGSPVGVVAASRPGISYWDDDGEQTWIALTSDGSGDPEGTSWFVQTQIDMPPQVNSLADLATDGIVARIASNTITARTLIGTANQINVANGNCVLGNPTLTIASDPVIPGTGGMVPPKGSTLQQVSVVGNFRFNEEKARHEGFTGTDWVVFGIDGYTTVQNEGTPVTARPIINFVGSAVNAVDDGTVTVVSTHAQVNSLADLASNGLVTRSASNTITARTITGTANQLAVAAGDGVSGNPTISIVNNVVLPGTTGLMPPVGTTAQRVNTEGIFRYNADTKKHEGYNGTVWQGYTAQGTYDIKTKTTDFDCTLDGPNTYYRMTTNNMTITLGPSPGDGSSKKFKMVTAAKTGTFILTGAEVINHANGDSDQSLTIASGGGVLELMAVVGGWDEV